MAMCVMALVGAAPLVHREITFRVLAGPQGSRLRQNASARAPARRIARAIRWLTRPKH